MDNSTARQGRIHSNIKHLDESVEGKWLTKSLAKAAVGCVDRGHRMPRRAALILPSSLRLSTPAGTGFMRGSSAWRRSGDARAADPRRTISGSNAIITDEKGDPCWSTSCCCRAHPRRRSPGPPTLRTINRPEKVPGQSIRRRLCGRRRSSAGLGSGISDPVGHAAARDCRARLCGERDRLVLVTTKPRRCSIPSAHVERGERAAAFRTKHQEHPTEGCSA